MMTVLLRQRIPVLSVVAFLLLLIDGSRATVVSGRRRSSPQTTRKADVPAAIRRGGGLSAWTIGLRSGLSSALAAACVKTTLQPVDAIKTLQQYHQATSSSPLSVWQACKEITARPGGIANLYAGLGVTVFGAMPSVALYFGVYSYCKRRFLETEAGSRRKTASIALSAAIGNTVASFSRVPYEVLKQKLQAGVYTSTWEALRVTAQSGEWGAFLFPKGGIAIQMARDIPYAVVTLLAYESLQAALKRSPRAAASSRKKAWDFLLGGTAGGLGSYVTNPADVVKTRLQTDSVRYDGSMRACAIELWQEGGPAAFLRGSVPRLMHKIPANAFFFLFYEFFKRVLGVPVDEERKATVASPTRGRVQKR